MYKVITQNRIEVFERLHDATDLYCSLCGLRIPVLMVSESQLIASTGMNDKDILARLIARI